VARQSRFHGVYWVGRCVAKAAVQDLTPLGGCRGRDKALLACGLKSNDRAFS
jgi:hypothetical protein